MNKRTVCTILLTAALSAGAMTLSNATEKNMRVAPTGKTVPFSVMGIYSGMLSGEIVVDGQSVFITDKTTFHKVESGPVEGGLSVTKAPIVVTGVMKGKKAMATMIVIGERESSADYSQTTVEGASRDPKAAKPKS